MWGTTHQGFRLTAWRVENHSEAQQYWHPNQAAIALYEKFGFTTFGTETRALKIDGRYADEVLMIRFY